MSRKNKIETDRSSQNIQELEAIGEEIQLYLSVKDAAREKALRLCREVIRYSANAIHGIHHQQKAQAEQLLNSASKSLNEMSHVLNGHDDLLYSRFVHDAQKELAEGYITLALINDEAIPEPKALGVNYPAYLNGLGEAVGELRRYLLDSLRRDDLSRCEELLTTMDNIYTMLMTMDFPEAITYGLRRTSDAVRGILERTRGDLTMALRQKQFQTRLETLVKQADHEVN